MTKYLFFWLSIFFFLHQGPDAQQEILVRLDVDRALLSLHIENTRSGESSLTKEYLSDIEGVLHYDLSYNGRTKVVGDLRVDYPGGKRTEKDWYALGVSYLIRPYLLRNVLTLSVISSETKRVEYAEDLILSGELSQDRRKIHSFCQHLHGNFFKEEGPYESHILYTLSDDNPATREYVPWVSEVFICDWDGANAERLTREGSYCVTPCSVPNDSGFLYVSYKIGQPKIFWSPSSDATGKRFTYLRGNQLMPDISSQGNLVAFINDAPGNPEVFVQEFNPRIGAVGKPRQVFASKRSVQASPTFSPDGKSLAFVSDKEGSPRIYVIDLPEPGEGTPRPFLISRKNRENTKPSWSPDGNYLAYSARTEGVRQIWIYDFREKKEKQLTFGPGDKENPSWAFNSLHLLFNSVGNSSCELYLLRLNHPDAVRLKTIEGIKRFPVWVKGKGLSGERHS